MRKVIALAVAALALAPVAGLATPTPTQAAAKDCAALRAKIGVAAFNQAFGTAGTSNAFGNCVAKMAQLEQRNASSANALCRAERADPNFAATHGGKTFAQFYGSGRSGRNAFGNCVSRKARSSSAVEQSGLNPAQTCSALRASMTRAVFAQAFGTNANHRNAFGKCVSLVARAQSAGIVAAASACLSELNDPNFASTHNGQTFQQFYGTNADLSNAFGNCVLKKLQASTTQLRRSLLNAAKTCKAMRSADPAGFRQKYGTRANAFAKCVAAHAKQK